MGLSNIFRCNVIAMVILCIVISQEFIVITEGQAKPRLRIKGKDIPVCVWYFCYYMCLRISVNNKDIVQM